ncbi:hypothetical protein PILCRDRAFT_141808 [Piloderma croceum F 1598]|uniref:Uncharacterized protein n=1 Tax=Piloderma croceum (strain F 1598) TaxID=765440 RepID=A0A0C3GJ41_PILCF|nr:hypothetical protein PILCRDRAFT_141808 [Piloderma croceum F 1598]
MCYPYSFNDQSVPQCPMCKVFRPSGARDVCRNRNMHPRHDVVHLKNAEVKSFNGCGYCKWAKTNPPASMSGYQNPGWPGCCRPPNPSEQRYIQAADWHSVSVVHSISIPTDIKHILDSLNIRSSPGATGRAAAMPLADRRNSSNAILPKPTSLSVKTSPVVTAKGKSGGSPQLAQATLAKVDSRGGGGVPSSLPNGSPMDQYQNQRRGDQGDKSRSPSSRNSPSRKLVELEGSLSRRCTADRRPSVSNVTPSSSASKVTVDPLIVGDHSPPPSLLHHASASTTNIPNWKPSPPSSRTGDRQVTASNVRPPTRRPTLELSMAAMTLSGAAPPYISSASSSSSSGGGSPISSRGSMTDSTVTSDGGFTDYLSDESEAELQRQAEIKAAIVAQNQAEEQEFKAARQQLADVDLRPPKTWSNTTSSSRIPGRPMNTFYTQGAMAQTGTSMRG